jgi:hypothetical protein
VAVSTQKLDKRRDRKEYYAAQAKAREKGWGLGYMMGAKACLIAAILAFRFVTPVLAVPLAAAAIYCWYLAIREYREYQHLLRELRLK